MSKTEYAWVIQRDDGAYWGDYGWTTKLRNAEFIITKEKCFGNIILYRIENCHPVKVEIRVVGE